ncbi:MAG TPA: glycosyltransferase family 4 protein [Burkholderiales bacterium]|nr:glycosyltransferase family 4 protein [Burkholderiales bacterium]
MRIAILNSYDLRGGAARAAYRLHKGLRRSGQDSLMVVQSKSGSDPDVLGPEGLLRRLVASLRPPADLLPVLPYWRRKQGVFYPGWLPGGALSRIARLQPDILHMHWISGGLVDVHALRRLQVPVVWTLHDMWAFTGGCHYNNGCDKYESICGACPVLGSSRASDPARHGWNRKAQAYRGLPLFLVSPSNWLRNLAGRSALAGDYPIRVIPNGIDTSIYKPLPRDAARRKLGLPADRKLILFGAADGRDPRKGMEHLRQALLQLSAVWPNAGLALAIFGADAVHTRRHFGMETFHLGVINSDSGLADAYSAADVFVAPSVQENLSNAVMEALACGVPCAAFDVGGMSDMIEHRLNGYLARPLAADDLAAGLRWMLENEHRSRSLAKRAREKVAAEFEAVVVAKRHLALYEEILASANLSEASGS